MSTPQSVVTLKPLSGFRYDKRKDGWELVTNTPLEGEPTLSLAEFLQNRELSVKGETMLERSKAMSNNAAGQLHAERLLEQPDTIPEEWRDYVLVFSGTVWRYPSGSLFVPYLIWFGGEWRLSFHWLGDGFRSHCRLVRLGKPA